MKKICALIIGLLLTGAVYGDCSGSGLSVFPNGQTICQNSIFVLDGYAESQEVILALNKKHPVYLMSGNKKVNLHVLEICVGDYRLTQAVLRPETELEAGLQYTMYIDSLPEYEKFTRYNKATQAYGPVIYTVISEKDTEKPQLVSKPTELKKALVLYGCGPSIYVVFSHTATDKSEMLVKTTVKSLTTRKETTYYIQPNGNQISVGHGMCAGAFDFRDGEMYEIEFSFMDACGNMTAWSGERLKFSKPTKQTSGDAELD
jgi:hypothetical protein